MENYRYKAKNEEGKSIVGLLKANNETELQTKLRDQGLFLTEARRAEKSGVRGKKMKYDKLSDFARNLSELIGAGVTLVKALRIIAEDENNKPQERKLYQEILRLVRGGMTLSDALAEQGNTFPTLFINMMKSSESTGSLDQTAAQMAEYYAKEHRLNQKVKSAMVYPKILGVLIVLVVAVIMAFVIPQFEPMFAQMDEVPVSTRILLGTSRFVANKWYILLFAAAVLVVVFRIVTKLPGMRYVTAKMELHIPVIGKLRKIVYTARFSRTLASLYSAGIPIVNCLQIAKTTIGNIYIESQFDKLISDIRSGETLSAGVEKIDGFVKKLPSTISVGEETGSLDKMLVSIADQMDYDSEMATQRMVALLEPVMIVVMAVIVGFIIISIIKPIYGSYQTISNQTH